MTRAAAFGVLWDSDVPLGAYEPVAAGLAPPDVTVRRHAGGLPAREALIAMDNARVSADGVRYDGGCVGAFDTFGATRVEWSPGPAWDGHMPPVFYSTLTAILLAWGGGVPMHGSAVEVDGEGVLVCGAPGAGKSALAAGLIAAGGRLVSDDLSVLRAPDGKHPPALSAGRTTLRLRPQIARWLSDAGFAQVGRPSHGGKIEVTPPRVPSFALVPLARVIVLRDPVTSSNEPGMSADLRQHLFRPRWMRAVPGRERRLATLRRAAEEATIVSIDTARAATLGELVARATLVLGHSSGRGSRACRQPQTPAMDIDRVIL